MDSVEPEKPLDWLIGLYITANEGESGLASSFDRGPDFDAVYKAVRAALRHSRFHLSLLRIEDRRALGACS